MKKLTAGIFTVLMGLVSVNAADAAVASKGYVDQFVGENGSITTKVTTLETKVGDANSGLVKDVADLQTQLENGELKINNDAILTDMIKDGQVTEAKLSGELAGKINAKADTSYVNGELDKKVNKADAVLTQVGADGSYIKLVSQADGKVSATAASFEGSVTDDSTSVNAPSTLAVATYVKEKTNVISEGIGSANEEINGLKNRADALEDEVDAINNAENGILAQAKADATSKANAAQSAAEGKVTELANGAVKTNTEAIAAINNAENGILAQAKADATSKANAAQSAAEGKVTELANGAVKTNTEAIAAMDAAYKLADTNLGTTLKAYADQAEADAVNAANGYTDASIQKLNLNELSRVPAECGVAGKYCVLTSDGSNFLWEVIERGADESQPAGQPIPSVQQ